MTYHRRNKLKVKALSLITVRLKKGLLFVAVSACLSSCTLSPDEAYSKLQTLEGSWKSGGSILVHQQWAQWPDSAMKGVLFTVDKNDSTLIEDYLIFKKNDGIFIQLGNDVQQPLVLQSGKTHRASFVNDQRSYPNKIILEWESDSIMIFKKENSRGNKPIEFRLKRY